MSGTTGGLGHWAQQLRGDPTTSVAAYVDAIDAGALDSEVGFAAEHARRYIATAGEDDGWQGPRPILVLYTTGRRSGRVRRNPLLFLEHGGDRFVIGSKGGADGHPSWYLNLVDEPRVHVRVMAEVYEARAEVLDDEARARVWPTLVERYPMFADYQARTARQIPLVRLAPTADATDSPTAAQETP